MEIIGLSRRTYLHLKKAPLGCATSLDDPQKNIPNISKKFQVNYEKNMAAKQIGA